MLLDGGICALVSDAISIDRGYPASVVEQVSIPVIEVVVVSRCVQTAQHVGGVV